MEACMIREFWGWLECDGKEFYLLCLGELKNKEKKEKKSLYKKWRLTVKLHLAVIGKWKDKNGEENNNQSQVISPYKVMVLIILPATLIHSVKR